MLLRFTFEGQSEDINIQKLPLHEGYAIQEATGWRMKQFGDAIAEMDMLALIALGWVILKFRFGRSDLEIDQVKRGEVVVTIDMFELAQEPDLPTEPEQKAT